MTTQTKSIDQAAIAAVARSVRTLTMDAVETSTTGHPGMPMGFAEVGAVLYGEILKHYNEDPSWLDRDRVVLSAGHGSMFLYSLLHMTGYGLPLSELRRLRRVGSLTPGHPEFELTKGVETTTGPLGQGFGNAVGMAAAETKLAAEFNTAEHTIIDHYTYCIVGDGCLMEGIGSEAASLAGHLKLGKLITLYDANGISIEGNTDITFTEDVPARFRAYGWHTLEGDAHDPEQVHALLQEAKAETERPTLIKLTSIVGKGAPTQQGEHGIHGKALGDEEIRRARAELGVPEDQEFYVDPEAYRYFDERRTEWKRAYEAWQDTYDAWAAANPELRERLEDYLRFGSPLYGKAQLPRYEVGDAEATRAVSGEVLNAYAERVPNLIGGSADLAGSNKTEMPKWGDFSTENRLGRTIRFGVREHAMAAFQNGVALHGGFRPFCATLFVFADYMRPSVRLASLMKLPVIYIFTHDSIYLGGDGPTHQPIEHLMSLRIIPNFRIWRPGDPQEAVEVWRIAMEHLDGPTAMSLSRQKLEVYEKEDPDWRATMRKGAYVVREPEGGPDTVLIATGSEVGMALLAADIATEKRVRVVSMPCVEQFLSQDESFQRSIIPPGTNVFTAEAGATWGWERLTGGNNRTSFGLDHFGASGRPEEVAEHFGFTAQGLADLIRS